MQMMILKAYLEPIRVLSQILKKDKKKELLERI